MVYVTVRVRVDLRIKHELLLTVTSRPQSMLADVPGLTD